MLGQLAHFGIGPVLQLYLGHVDGALVETMTKVAAAIELIILAVSYLLLPKLETLCIQRSTPKRFRGAPLSSRREVSNRSNALKSLLPGPRLVECNETRYSTSVARAHTSVASAHTLV